jgi:hypothetical protein
MKKLILLFFFIFGLNGAYAIDERVVDFYFGNGVWNTPDGAEASRKILKDLINDDLSISAPVKLSYNLSSGMMMDLIETFYQMKEEGQISSTVGFFRALATAAVDNPVYKIFLNLVIETLSLSASVQEGIDLNNMIASYQDSINNGHRVVLISHSQGNLFGVRAYDRLKSWQKKYFWQVSVATPAARVAKGGGYVTVDNDMVITPLIEIAGALPANARNANTNSDYHHEFAAEYLEGSSTRGAIISLIRSAYAGAKGAPSQWKLQDNYTCSIDGCEQKVRGVKHIYDSSINMTDKVYPFEDEGLLYPTISGYVKSLYITGESVFNKIAIDANSLVCYELRNAGNDALTEIAKEQPCPVCKGVNITPGFVEVTVGWTNPNVAIDLDVSFPNGNYDNNDQICLTEHFYSTSDQGVKPGLYPVYVKYRLIEDANITFYDKYSQQVGITIKVPQHIETRTASLAELEWLGGHVADIKVSEGNYTSIEPRNSTLFCGDCWSGGGIRFWGADSNSGYGGVSSSSYGYYNPRNPYSVKKNYIYSIIWYLSQAVLGPLSKANISIYEFQEYLLPAGASLYETETTEGEAVHTAGVIPITNDLDDEKLYIVESRKGFDIDADDDGIIDETALTNLGTIRLVMTGYELKNMGFKVNVLTEIIYKLSKDSYSADNLSAYMDKSDDVARCLMKEDINFDGVINTLDAMSWIPFFGKDEFLRHDYAQYYEPIINKIHNNQDITEETLNIYKTPIFLDKKLYFLSNASIGSIIGRAPYVCGNGFNNYNLAGENAIYFDINSDGNIILKKMPPNIGVYSVDIVMSDDKGDEKRGTAAIHMIHKDAPTITRGDFIDAIPDIIENGYNLGQAAVINEGRGALIDIWLDGFGAENFDIDKKGDIKVARYASIDRDDVGYKMQIAASNEYGQSIPLDIYIGVYDEWELAPILIDTDIKFYDTDASVNKIIGRLNHKISPFCPLIGFTLDKNDLFGIQTNGDIYLKSIPQNDSYTLKASAKSMCGNSNSANIFVNRKNRIIKEFNLLYAKDIVVSEDTAYIAGGGSGVQLIDISSPHTSVLIGNISTHFAYDMVLSKDGTKLFLADGAGGLKIVDITNPQNMSVISSLNTVYAQGISISSDETKAFLSGGAGGVTIIDISDILSPNVITVINQYGIYNTAVSLDDKTLFAATGFTGLKVFDISNANNPILIGQTETSYAQDITADGTKVYIADRSGGLKIVDISVLSNPIVIGTVYTRDANKVILYGEKAYISDGEGGLKIVDISDAVNPAVIDSIDILSVYTAAILKDKTKIAAADNSGKVTILSIE